MKLMDIREFNRWLSGAAPGDRVAYYLGYLCHDRSFERTLPDGKQTTVVDHDIDRLARGVWEAYENRKVLLVQEKVTTGVYSYIAIRI